MNNVSNRSLTQSPLIYEQRTYLSTTIDPLFLLFLWKVTFRNTRKIGHGTYNRLFFLNFWRHLTRFILPPSYNHTLYFMSVSLFPFSIVYYSSTFLNCRVLLFFTVEVSYSRRLFTLSRFGFMSLSWKTRKNYPSLFTSIWLISNYIS